MEWILAGPSPCCTSRSLIRRAACDLPEPGRPRRMTTSLRALLLRPGGWNSVAALTELSGTAGSGRGGRAYTGSWPYATVVLV